MAIQQLIIQTKNILHYPGLKLEEHLKERSDANQRLVRALHLTNTFVSPDLAVHKAFVERAHLLLKTTKRRGWAHFQATAIDAVQWQLSSSRDPSVPQLFDSFVHNVTLVIVLVGILQIDKPVQSFCHEDVALVAQGIIKLWALSKKPDPIPPIILEDLTVHLRRLVGDDEQFPNPLDFVVPGWETLWRVVATAVAYSYGNKEMRTAFEDFNVRPSDDRFRGSQGSADISVEGIVNEAMRLHPPSKHIGRSKVSKWYPSFLANWIQPSFTRVKHQADIEQLLRCDIWGPDANEFRPSRHHPREVLPEQKQALGFVFGYGPLRCIAGSWAPMAVGVIAGAILGQLEMNGYELQAGPTIGGREGWNGWVVKEN
ncbi:hypothetical protein GALMADRAFT_220297 [Galerina marginata CBS 339.88]|uniref:Cytochrome P450 n=1 Tax=Galerina marginata (strain CBS 339.88) TaxID=685588 RepID=A0A067TZZ3_GALM3|nr:hypothetical protein GALMADRAFT_220297 [Galerina marginata CBS 339.88]